MGDQYVVSARKYRPQHFSEVVGQGHITETLKNALKSDHLAHAFLFCGPRGVGKTTCARILAKVLNCEQPTAEMEPCGKCDMCIRMSKQASFNIIEQDGASNNKVDDIRDLIGHVNSPPPHGNYKVFIIDEVHMLTSQAFNAFLKTLEEPPPHAIFILATTEKHKILPTILSRCQIYDFKRVEVDDIAGHLQYISEQEAIEADEDALHLIAQKADGALRDSLSLFDRISSASDGRLTYQAVIDNLNILDYEYYFETTNALLEQNLPEVFMGFQNVLRKGFEPHQVLNGLSEHFRDLLLCQQPATVELLEVGSKIKVRYLEQARLVDIPFLLSALEICNRCDMHYSRALNKRLHVELALAKLAHIEDARDVAPFESEKKKVRSKDLSSPAKPSGAEESTNTYANANEKRNQSPDAVTSKAGSKPAEEKTPPADQKPTPPKPDTSTKGALRKRRARKKGPDLHSLEDVEADVDTKNGDNPDTQPKLEQDEVEAYFEKLVLNTNPGALKLVLKHIKVNVKAGELFLFVDSPVEKTTLLQEVALIQDLRDQFGVSKLKVHIEVDPEKQERLSSPERPKTKKEILDEFASLNPKFKEMVKHWKLTFDK
jgi:DNA polymerase-3 subunit gamma/tau